MASTKPRTDWDLIEIDYMSGIPLAEIGKKFGLHASQIARRATQKQWTDKKTFANICDELATATNDMIENHIDEYPKVKEMRDKLNNQLLPSQIESTNKHVALMSLYKNSLIAAQQKIIKAIDTSADQINKILANHKDGLFISRLGADGSVTYEPTNIHLKNLAPFFVDNHKAMGLTAPQIAIQNNFDNENGGDGDNSKKLIIEYVGT